MPAVAGLWAVIGIACGVLSGQTLSAWLVNHRGATPAVSIAALDLPIYVAMAATCVLVSRRYGSGDLGTDFGWRWRGSDVWLGLAVWLAAGTAGGVASLPWLHNQAVARTAHLFKHGAPTLGPLATFELAFAAIVLAPLLEELAFRGLMQRAFSQQVATPWAILLQALLFGAYHLTPGLGGANLPRVVALSAIGAVFGIAAARWKRLGPSSIGHAVFNVFFVISIVHTR